MHLHTAISRQTTYGLDTLFFNACTECNFRAAEGVSEKK